jgi:hypothetical protein
MPLFYSPLFVISFAPEQQQLTLNTWSPNRAISMLKNKTSLIHDIAMSRSEGLAEV